MRAWPAAAHFLKSAPEGIAFAPVQADELR
jgi:hypothetical protein